jgi:Mg2+ and Co2+ transporter CorA
MWQTCCRRLEELQGDDNFEAEAKRKSPRMAKICVQTASVFICLPEDNTVITYIRDNSSLVSKNSQNGYSLWTRVQKELKKSYSKLRQYNGQYLAYSLLDEAVDLIGPIISTVKKEIRKERELLKATQYKDLDIIHEIGSELRAMNRKLKPMLRLLEHVIEDDKITPGPTGKSRAVSMMQHCS